MKNKEFIEYLLATGTLQKTDDTVDYYLGYISNQEFDIKDIYMGLLDERVGSLFILKVCMLLCMMYDKQPVYKDLLLKILVDAEKFRLNHFSSKDRETLNLCMEDMITSIMNSENLIEMEIKLRKIQGIQNWSSVVLDDKRYFANYFGYSCNKLNIPLRLMSNKNSWNYIILHDVFDLLKDGKVVYNGVYGIGFKDGKTTLIREHYKDYDAFDYIIY